MKKLLNYTSFTIILIIATTILRIIIANGTGLGIGEAYYFKGAKLLQLSYFDQPPLFLWLSGISIRLFGYTNLALRIPAIVFFMGTMWLLFKITKYFYNEKAGFFSVLMLNLSFVFTVPIATWFQPDAPLMFFWLLCAWFLILILFPKKQLDNKKTYLLWFLVGISLGLATLSKYHSIFLLAGAFLFILFNKNYRKWLVHPGPYFAILINLIIALPIFIWNSQNDWVSFTFQGARAGTNEFIIHFNWFIRNIIGQALWLAPWIWVPLILELFKSYKKGISKPEYSFLFWIAILPIVFFTIITLWSDARFHFHWQAPGYLMLFIPLGIYTARKINGSGKVRLWIYSSVILTATITILIIVQMNTGLLNNYGINRIVENTGQKYDPTIEGTDYNEIYDRFVKEGWLKQDSLFIGATTWWQVGKTDWALKGEKDVVVFNDDPRNHAFFVNPNNLLGYDAIIVTQSSNKCVSKYIEPFFDEMKELNGIDITRNDITELSLKVYKCKNFRIPEAEKNNIPLYRQLSGKKPF